jgi:NADH dehydrogenase [ubiquinone] 1 alpha subcomplex assembly factor 7
MPEHQNQLRESLITRIRREGPISVADYMQAALDAYYKNKEPFGAGGDFTTAPEISQMFGEMVGLWLVDVWMQMGRPENVKLVELGPGRGTLAADIMRTISAWPDFKDAVTFYMVEISPQLKDLQMKVLKDHRAGWYESFSEIPEGTCFVIANEFFDALPVHQFAKKDGVWQERMVGYDGNNFIFTHAAPKFDLKEIMPPEFLSAPEGGIFEVSPASLTIVKQVAERIERHGGAALIIDYGHTKAGLGDTLQAVSRHKFSNVLEQPGEKDLTAHVDFATLAAVAAPFAQVSGPITQGQFLIALGIEARADKLSQSANDKQKEDIMSALCRLVAPKEMGRLFKVMALTQKDAKINPGGFASAGDSDDEMSDD